MISGINRSVQGSDYIYEPVSKLKLSLINRSHLNNYSAVELSDEDLRVFSVQNSPVGGQSDLYYSLGSIIADSDEDLKNGNYKFEVKALINGSAANLMGRFAHLDDEIQKEVKGMVNGETDCSKDCIDAEIVHLSDSGEGNVVLRPVMRAYEIPFATTSGLPIENQIQINDIYISVRHNQLIIRSKKHNKIIKPRLTTAHNYETGLPIYKFLCDLQKQELSGKLNWNWDDD